MDIDCPYPSIFDILQIYDRQNNILIDNLPLCEVVKGDVESIDNDIVKMKSFETGEITPYTKEDFLLHVQDAFQNLHIGYIEIILRDQTKVRI